MFKNRINKYFSLRLYHIFCGYLNKLLLRTILEIITLIEFLKLNFILIKKKVMINLFLHIRNISEIVFITV